MAVDKIVDGTALDNNLTSVANAIRTKGGTSGSLSFPSGFVSAIGNLGGGGGDCTIGVVTRQITTIPSNGYIDITVDLQSLGIDGSHLTTIMITSQYLSTYLEIDLRDTGFIAQGDTGSTNMGTAVTYAIQALSSNSITIRINNSGSVLTFNDRWQVIVAGLAA